MDTDTRNRLEQTLTQQWNSLYPQILERFSTVSKTDIAEAWSADDLVARIADKSHFSETYVEKELTELCFAGAPAHSGSQPNVPLGQRGDNPSFGGSQQRQ